MSVVRDSSRSSCVTLEYMQPQIPVLQVAAKAAIINGDGKVLIVREAESGPNNTILGKYTLVGGRIEPGEAFTEGLKREILEETGLVVTPKIPLQIGEWRPVIRGIQHQIIAIFMLCEANDTKVRLSIEHDRYDWIYPKDRKKYPMIEPDCFVVDGLINNDPHLTN